MTCVESERTVTDGCVDPYLGGSGTGWFPSPLSMWSISVSGDAIHSKVQELTETHNDGKCNGEFQVLPGIEVQCDIGFLHLCLVQVCKGLLLCSTLRGSPC
uniref:Uncharacterized protein n=1 Tax=Eutreptiella gymnastica TaxID=73025 RepID=A0A6T2CGJ6_9EUGL|mmetsp:Transcript_44944/g.73246  ORF Transcript_44944/g.73246 Transcript_44944/m.73246 type:complete len:101 (+) Transcript_44944:630-932(+)